MRKGLLVLTGIILTIFVLTLSACNSDNAKTPTTEDITEENLAEVCDVLRSGGLSNVDVFETWVNDYLKDSKSSSESDKSGFTDADCRMTVMLLAGNQIHADSVQKKYTGTYLMFDMDAIENNEKYSILQEKKDLYTTLFGEMPISKSGFENAYPENLKKYGIKFDNKTCSVISVIFKAYDQEEAFIGHTGILVDCSDMPKVGANCMFVEKIAFSEPFKVTKLNDVDELIDVLSQRPDYSVEEDEPAPLVYQNDEIIGELKK